MNKDNATKFLPLVLALSQGKTIQIRGSNGQWQDVEGNLSFNGNPDCYRVKVEPKEIYRVYNARGTFLFNAFDQRGAENLVANDPSRYYEKYVQVL